MIEPEYVKIMTILLAGGLTQIASSLASTAVPDIAGQCIERGGTGLAVALLLYACRALRTALAERQALLDAMHDQQVKSAEANAVAREKLATALDRLSEKLEK